MTRSKIISTPWIKIIAVARNNIYIELHCSFLQRAKVISSLFRDRPEPPLKTAVFWTEYIMRHQDGALHLRSAGRDLNFITFNSLDVILTLGLATFACIFLLHIVIRLSYRRLIAGQTRPHSPGRFAKGNPKLKRRWIIFVFCDGLFTKIKYLWSSWIRKSCRFQTEFDSKRTLITNCLVHCLCLSNVRCVSITNVRVRMQLTARKYFWSANLITSCHATKVTNTPQ